MAAHCPLIKRPVRAPGFFFAGGVLTWKSSVEKNINIPTYKLEQFDFEFQTLNVILNMFLIDL